MKKFFAALLVALFGTVSIFADDVADVKLTIVKNLELDANGDFAGSWALYAPDYQETSSDGVTVNYEQLQWMTLALDGKHPVEFVRFLFPSTLTLTNSSVFNASAASAFCPATSSGNTLR